MKKNLFAILWIICLSVPVIVAHEYPRIDMNLISGISHYVAYQNYEGTYSSTDVISSDDQICDIGRSLGKFSKIVEIEWAQILYDVLVVWQDILCFLHHLLDFSHFILNLFLSYQKLFVIIIIMGTVCFTICFCKMVIPSIKKSLLEKLFSNQIEKYQIEKYQIEKKVNYEKELILSETGNNSNNYSKIGTARIFKSEKLYADIIKAYLNVISEL